MDDDDDDDGTLRLDGVLDELEEGTARPGIREEDDEDEVAPRLRGLEVLVAVLEVAVGRTPWLALPLER